VDVLALGWREDRQVVSLLSDRVAADDCWYVRLSALEALAFAWPQDPDVAALLRACAANDRHQEVQEAAVQALGKMNKPGTARKPT